MNCCELFQMKTNSKIKHKLYTICHGECYNLQKKKMPFKTIKIGLPKKAAS